MIVKVPFSFKEMWEDSSSKGSELIEDIRKKGSVMNFEVKTCFIGKSHDFFKNKSNRLNEKRVDKRVDDFPVFISGMLFEDNVILNKKV